LYSLFAVICKWLAILQITGCYLRNYKTNGTFTGLTEYKIKDEVETRKPIRKTPQMRGSKKFLAHGFNLNPPAFAGSYSPARIPVFSPERLTGKVGIGFL
jgi:hypothetical protein